MALDVCKVGHMDFVLDRRQALSGWSTATRLAVLVATVRSVSEVKYLCRVEVLDLGALESSLLLVSS